jgi:hypothetical protein
MELGRKARIGIARRRRPGTSGGVRRPARPLASRLRQQRASSHQNLQAIRHAAANSAMRLGRVGIGWPSLSKFELVAKLDPETKCSARQKLRLPLRLFSASRSRHRLPPRPAASHVFSRRFMTWSPVPPVRRFIPRSAATFARGQALAHRPIAGDERVGASRDEARCQQAAVMQVPQGPLFGLSRPGISSVAPSASTASTPAMM